MQHILPSASSQQNNKHSKEKNYQNLWRKYFEHVNIKERKNMKLHIQHVPKRYWSLLTEKE
jgi:probable DNA metabolism protein